MGFSYIPDDDQKYMYLYHSEFPQARRVLRYSQDGPPNKSEERERLERNGWTANRFAVMLYHETNEPMTARSHEEMTGLLENGWSRTPPAKGNGAHPHANDAHRQRMLANQGQKAKKTTSAA